MKRLASVWWSLIRFGFRLLYNEMAFTYDLVSVVVSLGEWRSWQRAALKHLPADKRRDILELAHGTGNLQIDLLENGYQTIGYDLSPYMGQIASRKLKRRRLKGRLVRGKAQQIPFPAQQFSTVISTFPTDFIFADETLKEVHRVLTDNGRFIIVPNGVLTGGGIGEKGLEWLYRITGQRGEQSTSIRDFFTQYGFEASLHEERCKRSIAQVIVARKIP
ncbi:MAG: methyltransferase domain-containing protein [Chloroflexi bacterium]|nr:methyltransferase domain-containing protein [Chloroflexota bacterium]MCC6892116.1 methyltransferase domain-containing protein [Anaerolineae bacterium]